MLETWQAALRHLKDRVSQHNFETWFQPLEVTRFEDKGVERWVHISVIDDFNKAWLEDNYVDLIQEALEAVTPGVWKLKLEVQGLDIHEPQAVLIDSPKAAARQVKATQLEIAQPRKDWKELAHQSGMNPRYTFEEFVVGSSNQFVHAACQAVATNPSQTYNPLFIFGGVGLGKTHLLQAVGIEVLRRDPTQRVLYLSAEDFMNQLITSLRQKDMNNFRTQFRNQCDILLIDDIQFIGGKDSTQEEFFHTFNSLHQMGKQIVITSDKPPRELPGIEDRLASRFAWGLTADIQVPSVETRVAILEKKAEADGVPLPKDVAMLIASAVRSNVRELEGVLVRLGAQASLMRMPMTLDFARDMLKRMNLDDGKGMTVDRIIRQVSQYFGIKPADIKGAKRSRDISIPRQVAMYLARTITDESFPELGKKFGGKDHTTVLAACRRMEDELSRGTEVGQSISTLKSQLS